MKRKITMSVFVGLFLLFSVYSVGNTVGAGLAPQQTSYKVGIVYSTGGLGDLSFNDAAKRGIDAALKTHGSKLTVEEACEVDCTIPDITAAIDVFGDDGSFDLIIGIGFSAGDGVTASATEHTATNYMIIDSFVNLTNVNSIEFKEEEGSFLVGAMAAMTTTTHKLGFLGGLDIPLINRFGAGFEHGAKSVNPAITVTVAYSPNPDNPWGDVAGGKTIADNMMSNNIDIIFAAAGGTGSGVITAVEEANEDRATRAFAIGVDSDQDYLSPGNVLASMIKKVDVAVEGNIDDLVAGTWSAGGVKLGLAQDGVDISQMKYTQDIAFGDFDGDIRLKQVFELKQQIINGHITVAEDFASVAGALATTTPTLGTPITFDTESHDYESDDDDTPFNIYAGILVLFAGSVSLRRFRKH